MISETEKEFIANSYICDKCKCFHMHNTNLEGTVCLPNVKGRECDGILRRITPADLEELFNSSCTNDTKEK